MTLTTRLTLFFLLMQALVLIGFSTALYFLADNYLNQQVEERLRTVLHTISGAVEANPNGVEWEPRDQEHSTSTEFPFFDDHVVWFVVDSDGQIVARSQGSNSDRFVTETSGLFERQRIQSKDVYWKTGSWSAGKHWIHSSLESPDRREPPAVASDDGEMKYSSLSISAGVSLIPLQTTMHRLTYSLAGVSAFVWCVLFIASRGLCRRALLPVQRIAVAAEGIHAADLSQRLSPLKTGDELDQLTSAFNSMLDRLQEAFERQRRFTGEASHQLRTPLTAILGQVEVALRRERPDAEYRLVLETVHRRATHLTRMVESLLFLARADAEAQRPALEQVNLSPWLLQLIDTWSEHPRSDDIKVCDRNLESHIVLAQPELLAEIINIFLDNAFKFSEPGTPVMVRITQMAEQICVSVEDQGCGIDEDDLADLFQPFVRSSQARSRGLEGTGLGLSIAKRLSEVFGGDLMVVSRSTQGSCFTLQLPMVITNTDIEQLT